MRNCCVRPKRDGRSTGPLRSTSVITVALLSRPLKNSFARGTLARVPEVFQLDVGHRQLSTTPSTLHFAPYSFTSRRSREETDRELTCARRELRANTSEGVPRLSDSRVAESSGSRWKPHQLVRKNSGPRPQVSFDRFRAILPGGTCETEKVQQGCCESRFQNLKRIWWTWIH